MLKGCRQRVRGDEGFAKEAFFWPPFGGGFGERGRFQVKRQARSFKNVYISKE